MSANEEVVYSPKGTHVILDVWGCEFKDIDNVDLAIKFVEDVVKDANMHMLDMSFKKFEPQGLTLIGLLSESHISIHTYPEHGYMAIDLFTCGDNDPEGPVMENLKKMYNPEYVNKVIFTRGDKQIVERKCSVWRNWGGEN